METREVRENGTLPEWAIKKRTQFYKLSNLSQQLLMDEQSSVNQQLLNFYTKSLPTGTTLQSYYAWAEMGYFIKRGEKGYAIWGKPRNRRNYSELATAEMPEREKFYPIIYLFSSLQVQKRKQTNELESE